MIFPAWTQIVDTGWNTWAKPNRNLLCHYKYCDSHWMLGLSFQVM